MYITLNGESVALESSLSVSALLAKYHIDTRKIAIERNREIVPHSLYSVTTLVEGDNLEIVHFIGGG